MRLLFLSETRGNNNRDIKSLVKSWYGKGKIGYIPSSPDPLGKYFQEAKDWIQSANPQSELKYLDIFDKSVKWWKELLNEFSGFYISGGDISNLLSGLRNSGMGETLARIARETEKPILGVSEGGIALTPEINLNTAGLNLVKFEFCPHYKGKNSQKVENYLDKSKVDDFYGVSEDSGLEVDGKNIIPIGQVYHFSLQHHAPESFTSSESKG